MIDIHSHILPNFDDGASTMEEAIKMARIAEKDGIRKIIVTPHINSDSPFTPADIIQACDVLNWQLEKKNIGVLLFPGAEIKLFPEIKDAYLDNKLITLNNGPNILIELPHQFIVHSVIKIIKDMRAMGVNTIIAHPERNREIILNLSIADSLIFAGAKLQITAGSFLGIFGKKIEKTAKSLLENGTVHFLATDAHSSTKRPPVLSCGAKILQKLNKANSNIILHRNPESILASKF